MQSDSPERLDVLLLLGSVQLRGSSNRALALADRLLARRVGLKIVSTEPVREPSQAWGKIDKRVSRYLHFSLLGRIACQFLATDLQETPPDLIDIQHRSLHAAGSWLARRLERPYVVTVHDYLRDRERFIVDRDWCRGVIAVSESVRSELLDRTHLSPDQVVVIPTGVFLPPDTEFCPPFEPGHFPVIGTAGPLEAGKGLTHFLKAAARVLSKYPQTMFLIAGSGPEEQTLRRMAEDLKISHAVSILPNLLDFDAALRAMDLFVLPALKQGLGSIMLDAMAHGLPVIATDSGGVFSVVIDGTTGLLVPPSDDVALAERMEYLLAHPAEAQQLGAAARQHIMQHFQLDQMVTTIIDLYRKTAVDARSRG